MTTLIDANKDLKSAAPPPPQDLYAKRRQIYPKLAHGTFRSVKWIVMVVTLSIYYLLPWIRWDRGEGIPDQAVLADFSGEKFYFFFIEIWPQEIYYLAGLLIVAALGLFLVSAIFGRVWCGYSCPQTVWTDLYIWVERAFEGDRAARMRLDKAKMSANKLLRKLGKHIVWIFIAFITGGAFILYWHDAPTLAQTFFNGEAPLTAYWFAGILTFTTYFLAGTMREQVCTYMCPWPRIQGALTDAEALNVTYRSDRGEPRGAKRKNEDWSLRGDCIDCDQCVQVCPVGIDIRNGAQLECIHCALCIDACNTIMKRIGRPTGLIAYDTEKALAERLSGQASPPFKIVRPRTVFYVTLIGVIVALMLWGLASRASFEANILKDRSPPFVRLSDGKVRNGYTIKLVNKANETQQYSLSITGIQDARIDIVGLQEFDGLTATLEAAAHGVDRYKVYVTARPGEQQRFLSFTFENVSTREVHVERVAFLSSPNTGD